jgi:hypothetical protein
MGDRARAQAAPPMRQQSEQTAKNGDAGHQPEPLVAVAGTKDERLQEESGWRTLIGVPPATAAKIAVYAYV